MIQAGRINTISEYRNRNEELIPYDYNSPSKYRINFLVILHFKLIRKLALIFYIALNLVYHGLQIEFYRQGYNYEALRVIEIALLFIIFIDLIILEIVLLKLRGMFFTTILGLCLALIGIQIGLKIWGPSDEDRKWSITVNMIRIFLSLYALIALDEKEFLKFSRSSLKSPDGKSVVLPEELDLNILNPIDKNQNPDFQSNSNGGSNNLVINPKINLKNQQKLSQVLRVDVKNNSEQLTEGKIIEELTTIVKLKFSKKNENGKKEQTPNLDKTTKNPLIENQLKLNLNQQITSIRASIKNVTDSLDTILNQNFNIFDFEKSTINNSLFVLMNYYFHYYNFASLKISETNYMNLVYNIQKNYNENPYHNSIHSADVTNTCYFILERCQVRKDSAFTDLETLIILLSCSTHDIDHPGRTNAFEINSRSLLALTYNDKSVLENYHLFLFFNFLINDNMNIFSQFDLNEIKSIRKLFINNIISTDMMNHALDLKKFKELMASPNFDKTKTDNKEFIMTQITHFCDISNGTKPMAVYEKWVSRLFKEFFSQGDKEKEMGLPISMLCDREKTVIPDSQVFFINFFTKDLLTTLQVIYPQMECLQQTLESNRKEWEEKKGKPYEFVSWE